MSLSLSLLRVGYELRLPAYHPLFWRTLGIHSPSMGARVKLLVP